MKKITMLFCCAALCVAQAAVLRQLKNLKEGELDVTGAGRIAAVEVVSPVAKSGTVTLSRVIPCDVYTNAYATSTSTSTVIEVASTVTNRFFDFYKDGEKKGQFLANEDEMRLEAVSAIETNRYFDLYVDGSLARIFEEGAMLFESGDWRIMYGRRREDTSMRFWWSLVDPSGATNAIVLAEPGVGYNAHELDFGSFGRAVERIEYTPTSSVAGGKVMYGRSPVDMVMTWWLIGADGATNAATRAEAGVGWLAHSINFGEAGLLQERVQYENSYATNTVVTVSTNSVTPVLKERAAITNELINGSCSGGYYYGAPSNTWIFVGDKLLFGGTAAGGTLRLVVE